MTPVTLFTSTARRLLDLAHLINLGQRPRRDLDALTADRRATDRLLDEAKTIAALRAQSAEEDDNA